MLGPWDGTARGASCWMPLLVVLAFVMPSHMHAQVSTAERSSPLRSDVGQLPGAPALRVLDTVPGLLRVMQAASALDDVSPTFRRYVVTAAHEAGAWRTPQEARRRDVVRVEADGRSMQGAWRLDGGVHYQRHADRDVMWRNQSAASLLGGYVWADSIGGTFRGDFLGLRAGVQRPLRSRAWAIGLPVDLALGQEARQNDPRPLVRRRVASVAPDLRWERGSQRVAVGATMEWTQEDLEIGGGVSPDVPLVYRLRGLATFDRTQLNSAERRLTGRALGVRAGWQWQRAASRFALGYAGRVTEDEVRDGIAAPVTGGASRRQRHDLRLGWRHIARAHTLDVDAWWRYETRRGTDPVFRAVNIDDEAMQTHAAVAWWMGRNMDVAPWWLHLAAEQRATQWRDLAAEARWEIPRWQSRAVLGRQWHTARGFLAAHGDVIWSPAPDAVSDVRRISPVWTQLTQPWGTAFGAGAYGWGGGLSWRPAKTTAPWRVRGDFTQWCADLPDASARALWTFTLELR